MALSTATEICRCDDPFVWCVSRSSVEKGFSREIRQAIVGPWKMNSLLDVSHQRTPSHRSLVDSVDPSKSSEQHKCDLFHENIL